MKANWKAILFFYTVACAWSWPFFWWRDIHPESWASWQVPGFIKTWVIMWGPAIAAALATFLFKTGRWSSTLAGTSLWRSCAILFAPFVALAFLHKSLTPLFLIIFALISTLGEELGWRGFLQNSLARQSRTIRYVIIGVLWEFWHFTSRTHVGTLPQIFTRLAIFCLLLVVLSFIIGYVVERTKSLLVAVTLHASFNLSLGEEIQNGWQAVLIALPLWGVLLYTWPKAAVLKSHPQT